ncbi:MAG: DUF6709 family protein [Hyphomicrobiaceae bacterium]
MTTVSPTLRQLVTERNVRALVVQLVLLTAIAAGGAAYHREIYSRLFGPFSIAADEIAALNDPTEESRRFFTIESGSLVPLRLRDVTIHKRRGRETGRSFAYYFALRGKRTVLVHVNEERPVLPLTGVLRPVPADVAGRIANLHPEIAIGGGLAPLLFEVEDSAFSFDTLLAAGAAIVPVVVLLFLFNTLFKLQDYHRSPAIAKLRRFNEPVDRTAAAIDQELARGDSKTAMRSVLLTPSWLVHKRFFKLDLIHLNEVVWVYPVVSTRYLYWVIPISWKNYLQVGVRHGPPIAIQGRKKPIPEVLMAIAQRVPWIFAGYSEELNQVFRRNRQAFNAAVDQRREALLSKPPS